jgi:hypothetical protein
MFSGNKELVLLAMRRKEELEVENNRNRTYEKA